MPCRALRDICASFGAASGTKLCRSRAWIARELRLLRRDRATAESLPKGRHGEGSLYQAVLERVKADEAGNAAGSHDPLRLLQQGAQLPDFVVDRHPERLKGAGSGV